MPEEENWNRRQCLKSIGSVGATGVGVSAIGGTAAADENPIVELDGAHAKRAIAAARGSQDLRDIRRAVVRDGHQLRPVDVTAYEITPMSADDSAAFEAVMFEFAVRGESENLEVGVPIDDAAPIPAKATLTRLNDDEFPVRMTEYVLAGSADAAGVGVDADVATVSTTQTEVAGERNAVHKHEYDLSELYADLASDGDVGTQSHYNCDTGQNLPCWGCKDIVSAVNVISCGTYTWLICASLSIPSGGMGGLACTLVVGLICWALHHYAINRPSYICKKVCACP